MRHYFIRNYENKDRDSLEQRCQWCAVLRRIRVDGKRGGKRFWYSSRPARGQTKS